MWANAQRDGWLRLGKERKKRKNKRQDENIYGLPYYIGRP